jgi:hypothetical protein
VASLTVELLASKPSETSNETDKALREVGFVSQSRERIFRLELGRKAMTTIFIVLVNTGYTLYGIMDRLLFN